MDFNSPESFTKVPLLSYKHTTPQNTEVFSDSLESSKKQRYMKKIGLSSF